MSGSGKAGHMKSPRPADYMKEVGLPVERVYRIRWTCGKCGHRSNRVCEPDSPPCPKCEGQMNPMLGKNAMFVCNDFSLLDALPFALRGEKRENVTNSWIADRLGVGHSRIEEYLNGKPVRWFFADKVAVKLGRHPAEIWPEWTEILADGTEL